MGRPQNEIGTTPAFGDKVPIVRSPPRGKAMSAAFARRMLLLLVIVILIGRAAQAQTVAPASARATSIAPSTSRSTPAWTLKLKQDFRWQQVTPSGTLLVS